VIYFIFEPLKVQRERDINMKSIYLKYLKSICFQVLPIGNLTLTGYNSELSDRPFSDKMSMEGGFENSPIFLNRSVVKVGNEQEKWNKNAIEERATLLAEKAKEIWSFPEINDEILEKYTPKKKEQDSEHTISSYEYMKNDTFELYETLEQQILNLDASVKREYKKLYIAFKSSTNFVDIIPQASGLKMSLNINISELEDPQNKCIDVSNLGRWGNGDVDYKLEDQSQIKYALFLIEQALDMQIGE
jgi:predicted transport protein